MPPVSPLSLFFVFSFFSFSFHFPILYFSVFVKIRIEVLGVSGEGGAGNKGGRRLQLVGQSALPPWLTLAHPGSPWLARPTEQGEPPWLTPGSPRPLKAAGARPEPIPQEWTIIPGIEVCLVLLICGRGTLSDIDLCNSSEEQGSWLAVTSSSPAELTLHMETTCTKSSVNRSV